MKRLLLLVVASAMALASCALPGNPWPSVDAPSTTPHTVLMIGDSLVGENDYSMVSTLNRYGYSSVTVIDAHVNGSGLFGPVPFTAPDGTVTTFPSALAWVQYQVGLNPAADTVVMEYVGACATCDLWLPTSVAYGSDAFYTQWIANGKAIIDWLKSEGKTVFWVTSPRAGSDASASGSEFKASVAGWLSITDATTFSPYAGTPKLDWWYALNDTNGNFQQYLSYDGATHQVRYPDLLHIQVDGSIRTATWSLSALGHFWTPAAAASSTQRTAGTNNHLVQTGDPVVAGGMQGPP